MRRIRRPLVALLLAACSGDPDPVDGPVRMMAVELAVASDRIAIRRIDPLPGRRLWRHAQGLTALEIRLIDRDGVEVVRARTPDFRWARSEVMNPATGLLSSVEVPLESGIGSIRLPAIAGELVVLEPREGGAVELGRAPYDPTATAALRRPLGDGDVLGGPELVFGGGSKPGAIDILLLPDAYKEEQLPWFHSAARGIAEGLVSQPDFAAHRSRINVWTIDVRSRDDELDRLGFPGEYHNTAFDGRWGGGGLLGASVPDSCTTYGYGGKALDLGAEHDMDAVVMIANADGVRGLQIDGMITMGRDSDGATLAHELGHLLLDLGDEYTDVGGGFEGFRCGLHSFFGLHERANVQADMTDLPWWDLLTPGVSMPTPISAGPGVVGAFEGANHCESGWYRAELSCLMRGHAPMCAVCRRELDRLMGGLATEPPSCPESWRGDGQCDLCLELDPDCEVDSYCHADGICQDEHCAFCPEDCGPCSFGCGDGICAHGETDASCPIDCGCAAGAQCTNGPAPYGCYCDPACETNDDCCADHDLDCPPP